MRKMLFGSKTRQETVNHTDSYSNILSTSKIKGDIRSNQSLRIDAQIEGNIYCLNRLLIGEKARISGDLYASEVVVEGKVEGNISAVESVTLKAGSDINGDIRCKNLIVEPESKQMGICETQLNAKELCLDLEQFRITETPDRTEPADMEIYNIDVEYMKQ